MCADDTLLSTWHLCATTMCSYQICTLLHQFSLTDSNASTADKRPSWWKVIIDLCFDLIYYFKCLKLRNLCDCGMCANFEVLGHVVLSKHEYAGAYSSASLSYSRSPSCIGLSLSQKHQLQCQFGQQNRDVRHDDERQPVIDSHPEKQSPIEYDFCNSQSGQVRHHTACTIMIERLQTIKNWWAAGDDYSYARIPILHRSSFIFLRRLRLSCEILANCTSRLFDEHLHTSFWCFPSNNLYQLESEDDSDDHWTSTKHCNRRDQQKVCLYICFDFHSAICICHRYDCTRRIFGRAVVLVLTAHRVNTQFG